MARDKLPKRTKTNPKRFRFNHLVTGFQNKHPDRPLPSIASYAKLLEVTLTTVRQWAKLDRPDLYWDEDTGWMTFEERTAHLQDIPCTKSPPFELPSCDPEDVRKELESDEYRASRPPW